MHAQYPHAARGMHRYGQLDVAAGMAHSSAVWCMLQEELLANNVTLVLGVKSELLERLARSMGTRVVNCVDNLTPACVGVCKEFKVETPMPAGMGAGGLPGLAPQGFATGTVTPGGVTPGGAPPAATAAAGSHSQSVRTLMSFVCAAPVGATVLLRGASPEQLARVKRVARFAVYGAYSLRLENSLLACHITAALASLGNEGKVLVCILFQHLCTLSHHDCSAWMGTHDMWSCPQSGAV